MSLCIRQLQHYDKKRGLTIRVLADFAGVSESDVDKISQGKRNPTSPVIAALCDVLQVNEDKKEELLLQGAKDEIGRVRMKAPPTFLPAEPQRISLPTSRELVRRQTFRNTFLILRAYHGDTQEEFAKRSGISYSMIQKIEEGQKRMPSFASLADMCDRLGIMADDPYMDFLLLNAAYGKIRHARGETQPKKMQSGPIVRPRMPSKLYG